MEKILEMDNESFYFFPEMGEKIAFELPPGGAKNLISIPFEEDGGWKKFLISCDDGSFYDNSPFFSIHKDAKIIRTYNCRCKEIAKNKFVVTTRGDNEDAVLILTMQE